MLGVQVELLTGRYVSSDHTDRSKAEWPPHPARLYAALVATWAETGEPADEAAVLDALAGLPAPQVYAPETQGTRLASTFYVPVNDTAALRNYATNWTRFNEAWHEREEARAGLLAQDLDSKGRKALEKTLARTDRTIERLRHTVAGFASGGTAAMGALAILPEHRTKQARFFPGVAPDSPVFAFLWPEADLTPAELEALDRLLARVHRVGHSQSLVMVRRVGDPPEPNWIPHPDGTLGLRWVGPGQREALMRDHQIHQGNEPRVMPATTVGYLPADEVRLETTAPRSLLDGDFIIYERAGGPPVPITRGVGLAKQIHRALVQRAEQQPDGTVHPAVSGRDPGGRVTREAHVLIVPLPYVASTYADGAIMGVGFVIPASVSEEGRIQILRALGRWERAHDPEERLVRVHLGPQGSLELRRVLGRSDRHNLRHRTWCRPSRDWITATPMVLDRNPRTLWARDPAAAAEGEARAIESIRRSCARIGLPEPERIRMERGAPLVGTEPVGAHPPFPGADGGPRRIMVHVRLRFAEPVQGPVILGAGRFIGAGLFRPTFALDGSGAHMEDSP
jgi:CRISPR-associated protein Csb2